MEICLALWTSGSILLISSSLVQFGHATTLDICKSYYDYNDVYHSEVICGRSQRCCGTCRSRFCCGIHFPSEALDQTQCQVEL